MILREHNEKNNFFQILLKVWAFALILFHTLLAAFRYIISYERFGKILQWAGLGMAAVFVLFIIVMICISKTERQKIKNSILHIFCFEQILLIGILSWFFLSCVVNQAFGEWRYIKIEDWLLFDCTVCFLLMFPMAGFLEKQKAKQLIELLIHIVVISYSVFTIICLWKIFHLRVIVFPSGEQGGMTKDVQLMLGLHYNLTGMIAATMFCLCIYMVLSQKAAIGFLYFIFSIVQLMVVYLSNSRTVFVGVLVFVVAAGFLCPWNLLKIKNTGLKFCISILICGICTGLYWIGRTGAFVLFERITHFSEIIAKNAGELTASGKKTFEAIPLSGKVKYNIAFLANSGADSARKLTNLSNRTEVWKAAWKVMISSPRVFLFGVTSVDVPEAIWNIGKYQVEEVAHAHNIILQIGISMGVPAMTMFILFLISIAIRCVHILTKKAENATKHFYIIPITILCFTVINMAESYLVGYFSVMACFFYLFCGWITAIDRVYIHT